MMSISPSDKQKKIFLTALTLLSLIFIVAIVSLFAIALVRFLRYFSAVLMPIAVAGITALVIRPFYLWVWKHCGRRPFLAVAVVYLAVLVPLSAFAWFFGGLLVGQIKDLFYQMAVLLHDGWSQVHERWPELVELARAREWDEGVKTFVEDRMDFIASGLWSALQGSLEAGRGLLRFVGTMLSWAIFPIYLGFFMAAKPVGVDQLERSLPFLKPKLRKDIVYLATEFVNILVSFFRGQLLVAFLQGILYAIGFVLIGLEYGFLLGLLLGFMNIIPYLGSITGLGITVPLGLFQDGGSWILALAVVIVFTTVQAIESYVLTPRIMGDRTGLHPIAIIVAIFFWGTAFGGIWGMILAIPLTAFGVVFWRLLREKYMTEIM